MNFHKTSETNAIFALADLENAELLPACAQHHQPLDLVVDGVRIVRRLALLPVRPQCGNELLPVDQAFAVAIEQIGNGAHFHA